MRYLLFVFILFIVSCSKEDDIPKYNPLYSKIEGTWYTPPKFSRIRKWTFSKPQDSVHTQAYYFDGDTIQESESFRYYIDNQNILHTRPNNNQSWTRYNDIKIVNDTLTIGTFKFHR